MIMKQLFRHTSTLLRSALLLGAMAFVNIQQTQGQTAAQLAEMPDAFETVDPTTVDWSQEPYFYIQFFEGNVHSFLGEYGLSEVMRGKIMFLIRKVYNGRLNLLVQLVSTI